MKTNRISSGIIYRGPSVIDGSPVVVVVLGGQSKNTKTGAMVQTYIIRDDIDPITANRTGLDIAICGGCIHRGKPTDKPTGLAEGRSCYVNLGQGATQVYRKLKQGGYPMLTPDQSREIGSDRMVRLGTYGDPGAVPTGTFDDLLQDSKGHTGYTHQGFNQDGRLMVSADTVQDAIRAIKSNRRYFRVIPLQQWQEKEKGALLKDEILCPASEEGGRKTQCVDCGLCAGNNTRTRKNIAIVAHGATKKNFLGSISE